MELSLSLFESLVVEDGPVVDRHALVERQTTALFAHASERNRFANQQTVDVPDADSRTVVL